MLSVIGAPGLVDCSYARVLQPRQSLSLALKKPYGMFVDIGSASNDFECHWPARMLLFGFIDYPHAAFPELPDDTKVTDVPSGRR
jgi:hypothetical protein